MYTHTLYQWVLVGGEKKKCGKVAEFLVCIGVDTTQHGEIIHKLKQFSGCG